MKKKITDSPMLIAIILPALFIIPACNKNVNNTTAKANLAIVNQANVTASATATTYTLVWSDEFDGTMVNTGNWGFETGGGGWGNNEKEYYQAANATVANGNLVITAKKQRVKNYAYTSARLKTQGKREFTYGKIEARIKLPLGQGLWPAFWMLGANINTVSWPKCGETDIMEHIILIILFTAPFIGIITAMPVMVVIRRQLLQTIIYIRLNGIHQLSAGT
jgi:beta-glucanase (GH16 family)